MQTRDITSSHSKNETLEIIQTPSPVKKRAFKIKTCEFEIVDLLILAVE
jgi:hypothetical protein